MGVHTFSCIRVHVRSKDTVFSKLNAQGIYLKTGSFDPAFFRGLRIIGVQQNLINEMQFSVIITDSQRPTLWGQFVRAG